MIRALCGLAGAAVLFAVSHVTIMSTGGYGDTTAVITLALVAAVIVGAYVAGRSSGPIAFLIVAGLIAGEGYGFFATAQWHMKHSADAGAPVREAADKRREAEAWLRRLEADERVSRAEAGAARVQADAMAKSAERGCAANCRAVLEAQVAAATAGVERARESLQLEQRQARAALAASPRPGAENALAERLGVEAWELDLLMAGLRSFACTVMAGALLAFAAHGARRNHVMEVHKMVPAPSLQVAHLVAQSNYKEIPSSSPQRNKVVPIRPAAGNVPAYLKARTKLTKGASATLAELRGDYLTWCRDEGLDAVPAVTFVATVRRALEQNGIKAEVENSDVRCLGLELVRRAA